MVLGRMPRDRATIVDEDVDRARRAFGGIGHRVALAAAREIRVYCPRLPPNTTDRRRGRRRAIGLGARAYDVGPRLGKGERHRRTESATGASDERALASQREAVEHAHRPSSLAARMNAPMPL